MCLDETYLDRRAADRQKEGVLAEDELVAVLKLREHALTFFDVRTRDDAWSSFDGMYKAAVDALDSGKVAFIMVLFPAKWSEGSEWEEVRMPISNHVQHMGISRPSKIAKFGENERGLTREQIPKIEEVLGGLNLGFLADLIPAENRFMLLIEYYSKWATESEGGDDDDQD